MFCHTNRLFAGVAEIHGFNKRIPFHFKRLDKKKACNNGQNHFIIILLFLGLIVKQTRKDEDQMPRSSKGLGTPWPP
jgi:hypothetical protein